ncbi:hypothetical protein ONS95_009312 [Cadophora gregata]|uniref:uncharacterized protein n=1 Tax=Cadophora gregata TaxID=51156 RepID=UPI0026DD31EA|nr:uncharacterized protein ONS95_009312 [Cadophora gregata]KAK0124343.1 hypothetical protein ONS95_009312 [Cadophora gregata]KAK0129802.1 hypothetical protein ONS96_000354 [Cadophora gregata f. sp. sojae]
MALPVVKSFIDCSSLEKTVYPYLPQLYDLPQQILQTYNNPTGLKNLYLATNPLISACAFSLFLAPLFLIISEINKNYSQVDRLWSILPTIYNAHYTLYAHLSGLNTERLDNMIAFSVVWSLRLTFNYWRKGGYSIGSEDYRWEVLRQKIHPGLFFVFNVLFISLAQSILLFLITTPTYVMLLAGRIGGGLTTADMVFVRVLMALVLLEFFADQQQWNYQHAKKEYLQTAKVPRSYFQEDLDRGFVVTGVWSWSRHPNFAAEQAVWVVLYQWGCWTSDVLYNWTLIGAMAYLILFQASTWFTELITTSKYPEYKEYQSRVSKFIPKLYTDLPGDFRDQRAVNMVEDKAGETERAIENKSEKKGAKKNGTAKK